MLRLLLPLALLASGTTTASATGSSSSPYDELYSSLLRNYEMSSRPVLLASTLVNVTFSVKLNRLMDLDEKNQILHTNVVVFESWRDQRLIWNPADHSGLMDIVLPASEVWLPDVYVYNNAADGNDGFIHDSSSRVTVRHTGDILWSIPSAIKSSCSVDVLYFPFDHQFCDIVFASWTYDYRQLRLRTPAGRGLAVDKSGLEEHSELKVSGLQMQGRLHRTLNNLTYDMLRLRIHIERKALYYSYTVIAPSIMLCILTLFSFWLPCHIAEKIEIGLTVFLFLYFLELLIAENTPESNSTPIIGIFLTTVMTLNSLSLIMATIVMHVQSRGDTDPCPAVPIWLWRLSRRCLGPLTLTRLRWKEAAFAEGFDRIAANRRTRGGEGAAAAIVTVDDEVDLNRMERAKWLYIAEVIDKFLFEFYLACTVLSIVIVLHLLPASHTSSVYGNRLSD